GVRGELRYLTAEKRGWQLVVADNAGDLFDDVLGDGDVAAPVGHANDVVIWWEPAATEAEAFQDATHFSLREFGAENAVQALLGEGDAQVFLLAREDIDDVLGDAAATDIDEELCSAPRGDGRQAAAQALLEAYRRIGAKPQSLAGAADARRVEVSGL